MFLCYKSLILPLDLEVKHFRSQEHTNQQRGEKKKQAKFALLVTERPSNALYLLSFHSQYPEWLQSCYQAVGQGWGAEIYVWNP